jgi:hypothetical protein
VSRNGCPSRSEMSETPSPAPLHPPAPRPEIRPTPAEPTQTLKEPPASPKLLTETLPWEGLPENANRPFQLRLPARDYASTQNSSGLQKGQGRACTGSHLKPSGKR